MNLDEGKPAASDAEILRRARSADEAAFGELAERYGNELYGLAFFLTGQASDAEDVVQETFLAAYEGLSGFQERSSLRTWLRQILVRQAARHQRSRHVRKRVQTADLSAESKALLKGLAQNDPAKLNEIRMDVLEVLQTLSPEHREIVVLREMDGLSYTEIAEVLQIPEGTVESRLYRARQELKELLKDYLS